MSLKSIYDGYVGFLKQAALGTAVVPTQFVRFLSPVKMDAEQDIDVYPEGGGGFYDLTAHKKFHKHDGSFDLNVRPQTAAMLFAYALGADAKSGAGPYTHVLTPARPLPYVTIERGIKTDLLTERIQDCLISKLACNGKAGDPLHLAVDFMGIKAVLEAANSSDAYETDRAFVFQDGTFTVFGGAYMRITGFGLNIDNNVEGDIQTVKVHRQDIQAQKLAVALDIEIVYDSTDTNYADIYYGGGTTIVETVATGAVVMDFVYGADAAEREFKFEIPSGGLVYKDITKPAPGPEPGTLRQTVSCDVLKVSGSELITVTFKDNNDVDYV